MPYPFALPTISFLDFTAHYHSPVYPSFPLLITTHRGNLRNVLKAHKRLPSAQQPTNLPSVQRALEAYLPHLLFLADSIHSGDVLPVDSAPPLEPAWRCTLTPTGFPGADPPQIKRAGLDYELFFTLQTLAYAYTLLARSQLRSVLSPSTARTPEQSQAQLNDAIKNLLLASGVHNHVLTLPRPPMTSADWPIDLSSSTVSALSSLAMGDATMLAVTKQDPFPSYISLTAASSPATKKSLDWLYNPPSPPTGVKALLLARLCIATADHAQNALALIDRARVPDELPAYLDALHRTARAKACRFLGIDAEVGGRIGEAIGWITLSQQTLGSGSGSGGLSLDKSREKKEAKRMERAEATWGADAGRGEEARVVQGLADTWRRENEKVFFQAPVETAELAARIPTGRECHPSHAWDPPRLAPEDIRALRGRIDVEGIDDDDAALALAERKPAKASTVGYY